MTKVPEDFPMGQPTHDSKHTLTAETASGRGTQKRIYKK